MNTDNIPTVALVGRPNVGKSAIFNRIIGQRISIVHDQAGVTRDRISAFYKDKNDNIKFELIDTGGILGESDEKNDPFLNQIKNEVEIAIASADIIIFVVDIIDGLTLTDELVIEKLRPHNQKIILAINKIDSKKVKTNSSDFTIFGLENSFEISAEHNLGFKALINFILTKFKKLGYQNKEIEYKKNLTLAIIGKPNVGKSSLINAIANDARTIVSPIPGATRDSIDIPINVKLDTEKGGGYYTIIDTAGLRKHSKIDSPVEIFSSFRAQKSILRADLVALVIDASQGPTAQDRKIARFIMQKMRPCIIVYNKYDLFHPTASKKDRLEEIKDICQRELFFIDYAPIIVTSAKNKLYLNKIFAKIAQIRHSAQSAISTSSLNNFLQATFQKNPPKIKSNKRLKLLYAVSSTTQNFDDSEIIPSVNIILFLNNTKSMTTNYLRFLENQLRKQYNLSGLPLKFKLRARNN